jgi:hypothetical protein
MQGILVAFFFLMIVYSFRVSRLFSLAFSLMLTVVSKFWFRDSVFRVNFQTAFPKYIISTANRLLYKPRCGILHMYCRQRFHSSEIGRPRRPGFGVIYPTLYHPVPRSFGEYQVPNTLPVILIGNKRSFPASTFESQATELRPGICPYSRGAPTRRRTLEFHYIPVTSSFAPKGGKCQDSRREHIDQNHVFELF